MPLYRPVTATCISEIVKKALIFFYWSIKIKTKSTKRKNKILNRHNTIYSSIKITNIFPFFIMFS